MSLKYNKVLVLGATSGIGWALAEKIVEDGKHAIIVGRRQEKLDEFQKKHGSDNDSRCKNDAQKPKPGDRTWRDIP